MKKNLYNYFIIFFCVIFLSSCSKEVKEKEKNIYTIKKEAITNKLFYSGIIQPIRTLVIPSPADGVIMDMLHQYGEEVKAGELLFQLSSAKFLSDYKTALMQYIKAKNEFDTSKMQLSESTFLHKNGLISDDDFKMKKSNYYAAQLSLAQAKDTLEDLLRQLDIKNVDLYKLTIVDIDKITQAMHLQIASEKLRVLAPASGVLLSSIKNEENNKKLLKGDSVKQGDVLAMIGDLSGLSVEIKVNELTINQLQVGGKVRVTGIAFPDFQLQGKIRQVDRQGEASMSGLPSFAVIVEVPRLTAEQQQTIHVGMTAKVELTLSEQSKIIIPIHAVKESDGEFYVNVLAKDNKINQVAIKTGKSSANSVAVLSGLDPGDKIVITD